MRICFTILVVLSSFLLQACSTTKAITATVPGRELSRTSLGEREIDNRVILDEVEPLSVKLFRRISKVEYIKTEYQAVRETRHETTTYECSNAYDKYPAFLITTFAVPVLYEMVTGFDILRGMCEKNPPTYVLVETAETGQTLSEESFDKEKIVYQEIPIAGEPVALEISGKKFVALTSSAGIAAFPAKDITSFYDSEKSRSFDYQYNDVRLATPFKLQEPKKEPVKSAELKPPPEDTSDEPSASQKADSDKDAPVEELSGQPDIKPDPVNMTGETHSAPVASAPENMKPAPEILQTAAVSAASAASAISAASAGMTAGSNAASVTSGSSPDSLESREWKIILDIKFDTNKAVIRREYYPRLKEIAETLVGNPWITGVIEGHTDNVGSKKLNQKISLRRAEAVAQHLIRNFGIAPDRFRVEGFGMSRPVADNATPKGRAMNRRIEAKFEDLSKPSMMTAP